MGIHTDAQVELAQAFQEVYGREPTVNERLFAGAIAFGESDYSRAKYTNKLTGESKVLNNFGAIQCSHGPPCGANCFEVSDYDVLPDGTHKPFNWCYRDDPSREIAAKVFIETLYQKRPQLLAAATSYPSDAYQQLMKLTGVNKVYDPAPLYDKKGTKVPLSDYLHIAWFSHVMRDSGYFGLELAQHIGSQIRYHMVIGKETGEYVDGGSPTATPKAPPDLAVPVYYLQLSAVSTSHDVAHVHEGMQDANVMVIQSMLRTKGLYKGKLDGDWGPLTETAVRTFLGLS